MLSITLQKKLDELLTFIVDPTEKEELRSFVAEHPELLEKILENFEQKKEIFQSGDKKALQKLLEEERQMVASV